MRRAFVVLVVSILAVVAVLPANGRESAGKKKKRVERVEEKSYVGGWGVAGQPVQSLCVEDGIACATFAVEKGERYVALEATDVTGQPVYASVYVYGYSDGNDSHEHICAKSEQPFALQPGLEELVVVPASSAGGTSPDCTGLVVQGTITATFSNLP